MAAPLLAHAPGRTQVRVQILVEPGCAVLLSDALEPTEAILDAIRALSGVTAIIMKSFNSMFIMYDGVDWEQALRGSIQDLLWPPTTHVVVLNEAAVFCRDREQHVFTMTATEGPSLTLISYGFHEGNKNYNYPVIETIVGQLRSLPEVAHCEWSTSGMSASSHTNPPVWYHPKLQQGRRRPPIEFKITLIPSVDWSTVREVIRNALARAVHGTVHFDGAV